VQERRLVASSSNVTVRTVLMEKTPSIAVV